MQKLLNLFKSSYYKRSLAKYEFGKYAVTALLIFIPLFQKFPAFRIMGTYVAIRLEDFLILGTLLLFLVPLLKNIKLFLKEKTVRAILLFITIGLISLVSGIYLTQTVSLKIGFLHWIRRIEYFSLFFVGLTYMKISSKKDFFGNDTFFSYVIKILLLVNLFVFLYGIGQHYLNFPVIITQNEEYSKGVALRWIPGAHINSTFAGHYDLASYLVLTMPIFISSFFILKDKLSKYILATSIVFGYWLFSVAVSRISIVAFLISTTISLFLLKKYKEILLVVSISVIIFGLSADLRTRYGRIIEVVRQKISSAIVVYAQEGGNVNEDRSTSIRFNVEWPRAFRAFYKNPIVGTGYSSITLATDNDYLRALGETGLLGLISFILIFIGLFAVFNKYKIDDNLDSVFVVSFIGSTVGILITAVFIDIFEASKFATMYWLFAGLVVGKKYEQI
ncbi:MAG: hypothetical protein ACD_26C00034G0007 [uncultured bacterium]|nr:MAG: hypothetical protein ACD_26C00034G0007 [uncultured bacterium]